VSSRPRPSRSPIRPITGVATDADTRYAVSSHDTRVGWTLPAVAGLPVEAGAPAKPQRAKSAGNRKTA
jgi:hypothetical protein